QSLARAHRELEALGFRRSEGWLLEGSGILARILAPRPRAFVKLELPAKLEALNLVDRAPTLHLQVIAGEGWEGDAVPPGLVETTGGARQKSGEGEGGAARWAKSGISWLEATGTLTDGERQLAFDFSALGKAFEGDPEGLVQLADGT